MWEAIRSNQRRSWFFILLMGILLVALGATIGMAVVPRPNVGGVAGASVAALVWLVLWLIALLDGDNALLAGSGAVEIKKEDAPQLWNVVEEMTIAAGLPKMPRILVIDRATPNAFAVGRRPEIAAVIVTSGLLRRLNRDELQGVIGHEIGHVRNFDIRYMAIVGVMLGAIIMISDVFLQTLRFGGLGGRRSSSSEEGGGGNLQIIMLVAALVLSILAPLLAQLLYFACSRRREFLADASSARFTRYPEGLASALEKIAASAASMSDVSRVLAPMYTVNPRAAANSGGGLFSTHPPTETRIKVLRSMAGHAGLVDYNAAYQKVTGRGCLGNRTLSGEATVAARAASPAGPVLAAPAARARATSVPPPPEDSLAADHPVARARATSDLFRRLANFLVIPCECGVRIKVPPGYKGNSIRCARCGRIHPIPMAAFAGAGMPGMAAAGLTGLAAAGLSGTAAGTWTGTSPGGAPAGSRASRPEIAPAPTTGTPIIHPPGTPALPSSGSPPAPAHPGTPPTLHYHRRGMGWESFRCQCGRTLQVGPAFTGTHLTCPSCHARIEIS